MIGIKIGMLNKIYTWICRKLQVSIRHYLGKEFEELLQDMRPKDRARILQAIKEVDATFLPIEEREKLLEDKLNEFYTDVFKEKTLEVAERMERGPAAFVATSKDTTISSSEMRFARHHIKASEMVKKALLLIEDFPYEHIDEILAVILKANAYPFGNNWETLIPFENEKFPAWYIGRYVSTMLREAVNFLEGKDNRIANYTISVSPFCPYPQHQKLKGIEYPIDGKNPYLLPFLQFGCDCRFRPSCCFDKKELPSFGIKKEKYRVDIKDLPFHPKRKKQKTLN